MAMYCVECRASACGSRLVNAGERAGGRERINRDGVVQIGTVCPEKRDQNVFGNISDKTLAILMKLKGSVQKPYK